MIYYIKTNIFVAELARQGWEIIQSRRHGRIMIYLLRRDRESAIGIHTKKHNYSMIIPLPDVDVKNVREALVTAARGLSETSDIIYSTLASHGIRQDVAALYTIHPWLVGRRARRKIRKILRPGGGAGVSRNT